MLKTDLLIIFSILTTTVFAQNSFLGDVLDKNYAQKFKLSKVVMTDSSSATNGVLHKSVCVFNEKGLILEKTEFLADKESSKSVYIYDKNDNLTDVTFKNGKGANVGFEKRTYDDKNRLKEVEINFEKGKNIVKEITTWVDDSTKQVDRIANGKTVKSIAIFNSKNQPLNETFEDESAIVWKYDAAGKLFFKDEKGIIERYEFDNANRVTFSENINFNKTFVYDNTGRLTQIIKIDNNERNSGWEKFEY